MLKSDYMHTNLKVRSACKRLICAVNDNPSAFDGLEVCPIKREEKKTTQLRDIGFFSIMILTMSKLMGWH